MILAHYLAEYSTVSVGKFLKRGYPPPVGNGRLF
jgi:hypothetical protein